VGETLIEQDINGHLREELMIFTAALSGYKPLELEKFLDQPGANITREHVGYDIVGKQIRRKPRDKVGWDLPEPLAVEWYSLGYRPIGNNGFPDINDISIDMEEG